MKKLNAILFILLIICLIYIIYEFFISDLRVEQPKIETEIKITHMTDKEFESVGTAELENPTKEDFRNIEFTLKMSHSDKINYRNIIVPNLKKIANSYDINRYWYGQSFSQDNTTENFAIYTYNFVFYSKGLDDLHIKNIFSSANVKISWANNFNEKELNLGNYIQFQ